MIEQQVDRVLEYQSPELTRALMLDMAKYITAQSIEIERLKEEKSLKAQAAFALEERMKLADAAI